MTQREGSLKKMKERNCGKVEVGEKAWLSDDLFEAKKFYKKRIIRIRI